MAPVVDAGLNQTQFDDEDFTEVQFKRPGEYTLKLEVDDGASTISDTVKIVIRNTMEIPKGGITAQITAESLNIREDHSENSSVLGYLYRGDKIMVIDIWMHPNRKETWVKLKDPYKGKVAWCNMVYHGTTHLKLIG